MSWSIALIKNTLTIPESAHQRVARALMLTLGAEDEAEVIRHRFGADGGLKFHEDDMEHMDYLTWDDKACEEVAAAGGQGHVLFGSLEGDNKGQFWGAEFKDGVWTRLTATVQDIVWSETPQSSSPAPF